MKIVICDDSEKDREDFVKLLEEYAKSKDIQIKVIDAGRNDNKVEFSFVEGKKELDIEDIIYIETSGHKNLFYTQDEVYSIYRKLDDLEEELKDRGFVRIHLSFLVNMRYIEKISSYILTLTNGEELSVPKSRYKEVKRQYALFKESE